MTGINPADLSKAIALLTFFLVIAGCGTPQTKIRYPMFDVKDVGKRVENCGQLDHYLQQVDSIRWSMRQDGVELETNFEQMVQLSLATAGAIALVPAFALTYDPTILMIPYAGAFTDPDRLKRADVLLIALLDKRHDLQCPPHLRCAMASDDFDTLDNLRGVRSRVESGKITEKQGIHELTKLLDGLCPEGNAHSSAH